MRGRVVGFDHAVLVVDDVERSLAFYIDVLGLAPARVDEWRRGEVFFPSVRIDATTIIDLLWRGPTGEAGDEDGGRPSSARNVDHLCLVVEGVDLAELAASGEVSVVDGPDVRWGAQGNGLSLYVTDPDGNVIELRTYPAPAP